MPLASKDGKLVVKGGKLCSSCCGDPDELGACCFRVPDTDTYSCDYVSRKTCDERLDSRHFPGQVCYDPDNQPDGIDCSDPNNHPQPDPEGVCCYLDDSTEYQCESMTEDSCDAQGGKWHEGAKCRSDENPDGIDCSDPDNQPDPDPPTGACCYPDGDIPAHCHNDETQAECESGGGTWHEGKICNDDGECPPVDPPVLGICLYREDGLGTCWEYDTTEPELLPTDLFATYEEAQEYIDAGGCTENDPNAPECAKCYCYPVEADGAPPETPWGIMQECISYTEELDENGNGTGNYVCEESIYQTSCTKEQCEEQADANPDIVNIEWRNDLPPTHCRAVSSEDECTESTGKFCSAAECPENIGEGCPETPIRSNPLP